MTGFKGDIVYSTISASRLLASIMLVGRSAAPDRASIFAQAGFNSEVQFVYFPCSSIACKRIMGNILEKQGCNLVSVPD
jgi:hypothetical protein